MPEIEYLIGYKREQSFDKDGRTGHHKGLS
jgi:hypothetical protein